MKLKKKILVSAAAVAAITLLTAFSADVSEKSNTKYGIYVGKCAVSLDVDIEENYVAWPTFGIEIGYSRADFVSQDIFDCKDAADGFLYDPIYPMGISPYYMNDRGYCMEGTHIDCTVVESTEDYAVLNYSGIGIKEDGTKEAVNDYWGVEVGKILNGNPTYFVPLTDYEVPENSEHYAKEVYL